LLGVVLLVHDEGFVDAIETAMNVNQPRADRLEGHTDRDSVAIARVGRRAVNQGGVVEQAITGVEEDLSRVCTEKVLKAVGRQWTNVISTGTAGPEVAFGDDSEGSVVRCEVVERNPGDQTAVVALVGIAEILMEAHGRASEATLDEKACKKRLVPLDRLRDPPTDALPYEAIDPTRDLAVEIVARREKGRRHLHFEAIEDGTQLLYLTLVE